MESTDEDQASKTFLTADDLFKLRKPADISSIERISEKGYIPQDSDNYHVASLLKDKKNILQTKNVSRIADLVQAEWKPDINKAITTKLKGRTQHMGCSLDGKVGLCPEEIIYLLESGNLELIHNGIPLSVESAYSTVLAEDLAVEKYQVYAYLSRLGYIVVQHQTHIDVSQQERLHAQHKCRCKKKRKQNEAIKLNKKIRLEMESSSSSSHVETNSEEVSKSVELLVKTSNTQTASKTQDSSNTDLNSATTNVSLNQVENSLPNSVASMDELESDKVNLVTNDETNFTLNDHERETVKDKDEIQEAAKSEDTSKNVEEEYLPLSVSPVVTKNKVCDEAQENLKDASSSAAPSKTTESIKDNNDDQNLKSSSSTSIEEEKLPSKTQSESTETGQSNITCDKIKNDSESVATTENSGTKTVQEVTRNLSTESYIQLDDDESNKSVRDLEYAVAAKLKSDDEQTSDSDVLSLYADSNDDDDMCELVNDDSVQSVADNEVAGVDDVMVLEINKPEAEPLAVIDLSSDEESSAMETNPPTNDDDEVLIISECRSTKPLRSQGWFTSSYNTKCKKEVVAKSETSISTGPSFPFPSLFKKRVICLPRPPPYLLPFNLCMNKEAYTVDLSKLTAPNTFASSRVWNSWRDLQERRNMQNSPGLNNGNHREFPPFSTPMNVNPFPYQMPPTNQHLSFPNNMTSPNMGRFGVPQFEMNVSPNSFQVSPQSFNDTPMCGLQSLTSPIFNRPPNAYNLEDSKRDLFQQSRNLQMLNSSNNENCALNPWTNAPFNERNNSRQNLVPNESRESSTPWRNIPPDESFRPFNIQSNSPRVEEYNSPPTPWGNVDRNPSHRFSGPGDFPRNQNFFPDHHPQRNFQNPWMDSPPFNHEQNIFGHRQTDGAGQWRHIQDAYPCDIPRLPRSGVSNWRQLKTTNPEADLETSNDNNQDDTDIQEVPIDIDEILWSKEIRPLIRPSPSLTLDEALKCIQKTTANLLTSTNLREKSFPEVCSIEISFDVYLPKTPYRRSCPAVPNHRIIVTGSSDLFPKLSDIYALMRKFKDSAVLQFAVVDNGDIAFYSFNNAYVPMLLP